MSELDRTKPFTHAWGFVADGDPFFFQDGKSFCSQGKEVVPSQEETPVEETPVEETPVEETPVEETPAVKAPKAKKAKAAAEATDENHDLL